MSQEPRARAARRIDGRPPPVKPSKPASNTKPAIARELAQPPIHIDLDPSVTCGFIHDRFDLTLRGSIDSVTPLAETLVVLNGEVVGRMQHDQLVQAKALDRACRQYAFLINLPLRRPDASGVHDCVVATRTVNGASRRQSFEIAVDPANSLPVAIIAGPTAAPHSYAHLQPPLVLYVERAVLDDDGQLEVHGWSIALTTMVTVQIFLGEELLGAARLGGQRVDVETAFPAYPNARMSGFSLSKRLEISPDSVASVRVQAISLNGSSQEACLPVERMAALPEPQLLEPVTSSVTPTLTAPASDSLSRSPTSTAAASVPTRDPRRQIRFFCDEIELDTEGHLRVVGWALCPIGISSVTIYVDDKEIGQAELGLPRADVGDEYQHIATARYSGFRLVASLGSLEGLDHGVRLVMRNKLDDVREEVRSISIADGASPPQSAGSPAQFRLEIDSPSVAGGNVIEPVTGRLTIEGWTLARSGVASIEVLLDDRRLGDAHYGLVRQDVAFAFPEWPNPLRSGFAFHCPPRSLRNGAHVVQLNVRSQSGEVLEHRFNILVTKPDEPEDGFSIRGRMTQAEVDVLGDVLNSFGHRPEFRLIVRHTATSQPDRLLETLAALRSQVHRAWRATVLTPNAGACSDIRTLIAEAADDLADQIEVIDPSAPAFDQPLADSSPAIPASLVGFLSSGDRLGCDALLQMALAAALQRDADFFYADEVRESPASQEREPFFKPDFSPDLLLSTNYIGRPWFASDGLLRRTQITARELSTHGEYDAVLRCSEQATRIHHVPKLLCERGAQLIDDTPMEAAALKRAAKRRNIAAEIHTGSTLGAWRFQRTHKINGLVSIIIPTCGTRGLIEVCIKTLRKQTRYRNFEIICVDNIPDDAPTQKTWLRRNADKVVPMREPFNWSHFNNCGAAAASGEYLLFLNDDIEVIQPDWLDAMLEHMQRPEVAVVGPQLLYPNKTVQHAGMFLGVRGTARHAFRFAPADEPAYFGLALTQRNVIAVTGACMLMRRSVYQALSGFEEAHQIINNDLDFCLRAHQAGKLIVYTPHATLVHHEAASRDQLEDLFDLRHFDERWRMLFDAGDPYFNPNLSRHSDDYDPDDEPVEAVLASRPLFRHADIKRILVVKVDHIGDFVTAIPAMRRLKQIFPAASIHVLTGRAARAFGELEDCIDEFIEFEYFHAVSGQGTRQISQEEYAALRAQLAPYRFDIAVDLRKHPDTRDILRHTPARFLAGYDYMGQFPFLDISLEWESDRNLTRKRSHVTTDLISLVEAIGSAGSVDRPQPDVFVPQPPPEFLPDEARALFSKPVVAVHPGVGNAARQWPAEHFAALIDLLTERNSVGVLLIGSPDEAELAQEVFAQIVNREAVVSLVGDTSLPQLFDVLRACSLYVGNNSGPKHIAAMLGVPTIGVHSGVVDAIEWAPVGRRAFALRRNMSCSPCYIERPEACARNMACLRGLEPAAVHQVSEILLAQPVERRVAKPLVEQAATVAAPLATAKAIRQTNGGIRINGNGQVLAAVTVTDKPIVAVAVTPRPKAKGNGTSRCNGRMRPV
jgi:ADP-heptose:LPS heptosyltransferase/GT2 family glycosyltransferase